MAIVEAPQPLAVPDGPGSVSPKPLGVFTRPTATTGWRSWITTIDHKKIGKMYGGTSLVACLCLIGLIQGVSSVNEDDLARDADLADYGGGAA